MTASTACLRVLQRVIIIVVRVGMITPSSPRNQWRQVTPDDVLSFTRPTDCKWTGRLAMTASAQVEACSTSGSFVHVYAQLSSAH